MTVLQRGLTARSPNCCPKTAGLGSNESHIENGRETHSKIIEMNDRVLEQ